jgi:hypothetical protein
LCRDAPVIPRPHGCDGCARRAAQRRRAAGPGA